MKNGICRSPLFYVGDKYKLIREIRTHFPAHINRLIEPFVGGGSVMMNVDADAYLLNDIDGYVIRIHKMLCSYLGHEQEFFSALYRIIDEYGLSLSYRKQTVPEEMKTSYPKTYFAKYNKESYQRLKQNFIKEGQQDMLKLYVLLIYGFNRMLRFNGKGVFNLPVGNVDYNQNTHDALEDYFRQMITKQVVWYHEDFRTFLHKIDYETDDLVYLDPPYLITFSEYNKLWDEDTERDLLALLDHLNERGIRFAISNVTHYRGRTNTLFLEWSKQYHSHSIKSNYISFNDNSIKLFSEVLVTNYQ
ncbi:MAG: Dam family site-specific DNA-(adenine-N6)-methyltransferase [Prevotella sp.]|jgi:DNA adenine methylase|nr:Dam family site-specific DNA-(adenine-N6)-methyltransferase [Prevotella sp.]